VNTNGFNLGSNQEISGTGDITKTGAGTLTLSGTSSVIGNRIVSAGKLVSSNTSTGVADITVADGAGVGVISTDTFSQLIANNVTLGTSGATTVDIDLGNFTGNPSSAPLVASTNLALNGTITVNIIDGFTDLGSLPLIEYTAKTGTGTLVLGTLPLGVSATLEDDGAGLIFLNVTSVAMPYWNATNSDVWDTTTQNWVNAVDFTDITYTDGNPVLFDDSVTGITAGAVVLNQVVNPGTLTFSNFSTPYSITGTGSISGTTGITKQGDASLTLGTLNNYTGITTLQAGITNVTTLANGGAASSIGSAPASPSNLVLSGGTLNYTGPSITVDRGLTVSSATDPVVSTISTTNDLTLTGQITTGTFGRLTKMGAGTLTLSNAGTNTLSTGAAGFPSTFRIDEGGIVLTGGGVYNNNGEFAIGSTGTSGASLTVSGATLNTNNWFSIGRGNGTTGLSTSVTFTNATVTTGATSLGYDAGLPGHLATSSLTVHNTNWTNSGATNIAESPGSTSNVLFSGSTVATLNDRMLIGIDGGIATVTIQDTASVTKNGGWFALGNSGSGSATMTVKDSGSLTTSSGDFNIGDVSNSQGVLNIQNSASVTSSSLMFIGKNTGTSGTINQSGGTLNGGSWISIGRFSGSVGIVNVSAGNFNQTGAGQAMNVGEEGTGTLTLSGSGSVTVAGTSLTISAAATANGTVNLDGGTLTVKQILEGGGGAGTGNLVFNGGLLKAAAGANLNFISGLDSASILAGGALIDSNGANIAINQSLTGSGGLTKSGAGTLFLNNTNTYSGTTTINAGTLGGIGSVSGPLIVSAASTIAPGNSVGTLAAGNTTISGTYACEVDGANGDVVAASGSLNISGATLAITEVNAASGSAIVIATYSSLTGTFSSITGLPDGYTLNYNYNNLNQIALVSSGTPFSNWAQVNITAINSNADASAGGDPDGDGVTNVAEFALDGNPLSGASTGKMIGKIASAGGNPALVLTLPVRTGATFSGTTELVSDEVSGIVYKIQGSDQLATWTLPVSEVTGADKTAIESGMPALSSGDWTYRTFKSPGNIAGDPADFLRAVIINP
jgi:autotransporter-associated beta strand protein